MSEQSFVDVLVPERVGRNAKLERIDTLLAYFVAARNKSRRFLDAVTNDDLEKPSAAGIARNDTIKISIARVAEDLIQHTGQIAYIRGLVERHGWYGA